MEKLKEATIKTPAIPVLKTLEELKEAKDTLKQLKETGLKIETQMYQDVRIAFIKDNERATALFLHCMGIVGLLAMILHKDPMFPIILALIFFPFILIVNYVTLQLNRLAIKKLINSKKIIEFLEKAITEAEKTMLTDTGNKATQ